MTAEQFLQQFREPDPFFGPVPAWWWSGDKLEWPRMRWQMDQMHAMGIRQLVIINLAPGGSLFGSEPDDPPFLSEAWWGYFGKTCDYAKEKGMRIWFYDQIGFSGANFQADTVAANPAFSAEQLRRVSVEGSGELAVTCPGNGTPLAAYVVEDGTVRYIPVTDRRVAIRAERPAKLTLVFSVRQGFDFLSYDACQTLLETVHRQFERRLPQHIGTTIVGSFQDELPEVPTWSSRFAATFREAYGYDLLAVIHQLFEAGDDQARMTRVQYHAHRATLAERAFFKPFFEWHEAHGMTCAFDQQSPAREARVLGCTQKYADYTRVHQWYGTPGCDLHGNGKLHASIAFAHKRKRVWLEGFHSTGWGGTIADTFDWLLPYLRSGSNQYNPHAIYYSTRKGWWEWAPPSTCWRQPYARHYPAFVDTIARLQKVLVQGTHHASVAVIFPTTTVQSAVGPLDTFPDAKAADVALHETIGSMRWHQEKIGPLDEIAVDFHLLDETTIASGEVVDGALTLQGVSLRAVVLPHATMIDDATADRLVAFASAGGKVVAVGSAMATTTSGKQLSIADLPNAVVVEQADELKQVLRHTPREYPTPLPILHRRISDELDVLLLPAVTGMATVVKWPSWFEPIEHTTIVPEKYAATTTIELPAGVRNVVRFDPVDGKTTPLAYDGNRVSIDFSGVPFAVVAIERSATSGPLSLGGEKWGEGEARERQLATNRTTASGGPPPHPGGLPQGRGDQMLLLSDEWQCEYVPTLPTEHIDTHDPLRPEMRLPRTNVFKWVNSASDFSQGLPSDATDVEAGFGTRAWKVAENAEVKPEPVIYSPEFGIRQDKLHINTLGPKGHVPEEFIDLGKQPGGKPVTVSTGVIADRSRDAMLVVGSLAQKSAAVNGEAVGTCSGAYQWMAPVKLRAGENRIELKFEVEKESTIRAYWCLADPAMADRCARPERIVSGDVAMFGGRLSYTKTFRSDRPFGSGRVKVAIAALTTVSLDGRLLGRQGGCDPYRPNMRGNIYDTGSIAAGEHTLTVEVLDPGNRAPVMVDLLAEEGDARLSVTSDASWHVTRDDGPARPVNVHLRPEPENAAWSLYRRPHPLPAARWIEGDAPPAVLDLPLLPPEPVERQQWFEWTVPPGATEMSLPIHESSQPRLWIDGRPVIIPDLLRVALSAKDGSPRTAVLAVHSRQLGGGVFTGPVTYSLATGKLRTGSWLGQGLRSYSGAMRMRQRFTITGPAPHTLDLGRVRGTVEATVNGKSLGVRFMSPYRFTLPEGTVRPGENGLELLVTNTLVNHMSTWSPSRSWSPDQLECGVLGPVRLID